MGGDVEGVRVKGAKDALRGAGHGGRTGTPPTLPRLSPLPLCQTGAMTSQSARPASVGDNLVGEGFTKAYMQLNGSETRLLTIQAATRTMTQETEITSSAVKAVRRRTRNTLKKAAKKAPQKGDTAGSGQWKFPKSTLEESIKVASAIEEKYAGNPTKSDDLVKAVGFNKSNDWRYLDLLRSANQYGLVTGSGITATVSLDKLGDDIVAPSSSGQRQKALLEAFRKVEDFKEVEAFYRGKKIPEDEYFENTLVRNFNIPRDRVKTFMEVFVKNLEFLRAFEADDAAEVGKERSKKVAAKVAVEADGLEGESRSKREFLDTCFVMMPFGGWFDTYYKDIYTTSIKEAGFEPVRGDELFSTGSVVEQIWEQVVKAKVLLADLTGKNANVFYELGLAHAARKPVVFTAAKLDDVPFDLRHLRVIIYDVNEPGWDQKLKASLTTFLKNTKADPLKSIPQPFRDIMD